MRRSPEQFREAMLQARPHSRPDNSRAETAALVDTAKRGTAAEQEQACGTTLRNMGLRLTRQRLALGLLLFGKGERHVTAEMLYEEATKAKVPVSLATIYNTLHQFADFGLLRQVAVDGSKTYFDTNTSLHHHFFIERENALLDIPDSDFVVGNMPVPPEGYEIARVDVTVRLRRKAA